MAVSIDLSSIKINVHADGVKPQITYDNSIRTWGPEVCRRILSL